MKNYELIYISQENCPPCKAVKPKWDELASTNIDESIKFNYLNLTKEPHLREQVISWQIRTTPSFVLTENGEVINKWAGAGGLNEAIKWINEKVD